MYKAFIIEIFDHFCDSCDIRLQVTAQLSHPIVVVVELKLMFL